MARILIIDDERQIRRILTVLLSEQRHEVEAVGTGEEGVKAARRAPPDLALVDLKLPGIDGQETLTQLLALPSPPQVVLMTAHGSIPSAVEAMRHGAFDYISKPFDNDELLLVVDRALEVQQLSEEVESLRGELESRYGFNEIVGISSELQGVFKVMAKVARVNATVLVTGESGTGKELVARGIHRRSPRGDRPFVAVNCSAIPATLVESEFFGHEKGAFTDAKETRVGRFEQADGGTLFLDEVGDLALEAQAKLLRTLQNGEVQRVGGKQPRPVDVRVVAATNAQLESLVEEGRFREDLYWRLNVVHLRLPPLRERGGDLPLLTDHFVERFNRELGLAVRSVSPEAREVLAQYEWPGNIRELENTMCRAMILCDGAVLQVGDLPHRIRGDVPADGPGDSDLAKLPLAEAVQAATVRLEKIMINSRLAENQGNRTATADSLGVSRKTLFNKMRLYGLTPNSTDEEG